ncbi:RTA1 like protein-domain-containing protein [Mrakia frigida]|uniref:RTA1 domain-containing protein n=1 Tax=Mrakia frigida TaxID=29902 RepID=UPI003FCBFAEF
MSGVRTNSDTALYKFISLLPLSTCIVFVVLFSISAIVHLAQATRYRLWWLLFTVFQGAVLEVLGWSFRLWSSKNPRLLDPFLGNLICLGLGPVFILGGCYLILGLVINSLGPQYSRLRPRTYSFIFCTADITCLAIQSVGGAMASIAAQSDDVPPPDPNKGARVILAGIVLQEAFMIIFICLGSEFVYRWARNRPLRPLEPTDPPSSHQINSLSSTATPSSFKTIETKADESDMGDARKWKLVVFGLSLTTLLIFVRSLYRTAELSQGWSGPIISSELLFNVLDGAMIICSLVTLNVLHPGRLLETRTRNVSLGMRSKKKEVERV